MKKNTMKDLREIVRFYLTTTSLHGAKHFYTLNTKERIVWLACSVVSTISAVFLCIAIWDRFLRTPVILIVPPTPTHNLPVMAVCLPAEATSRIIAHQLSNNITEVESLGLTISKILTRRQVREKYMKKLDGALTRSIFSDLTIPRILLRFAPPCSTIIKRCRFRGDVDKCCDLFELQMTDLGACCVINKDRIQEDNYAGEVYANALDLVLNCSHVYNYHGECQFLAHHKWEDDVSGMILARGLEYFASLRYMTVEESITLPLIADKCVFNLTYNRRRCMYRENACRCSDPLRSPIDGNIQDPYCQTLQFNCLRNSSMKKGSKELSCLCPPACRHSTILTKLDKAGLISHLNMDDELYSGYNIHEVTVLHVKTRPNDSRTVRNFRTENWLTLMASLGGIFNMFMGFGFFSTIEFLCFAMINIPRKLINKEITLHN